METIKLKPIGINKWQLQRLPEMQAEAVVYCQEKMLPWLYNDRSLTQLQETAMLPDLVSPVLAMPDMHEGYGIPVGGVMVTHGLISSGAVGMDINCGVRLLRTNLEFEEILFTKEVLQLFCRTVERIIPAGKGGRTRESLPRIKLRDVIIHGSQHLLKAGYATDLDVEHTEELGKLKGAGFEALSNTALRRAEKQLGTLGSGNHFIELQKIAEIFDVPVAAAYGLRLNQIVIMIHSGSRALGHQTCLDYSKVFYQQGSRYGIKVPTRDLAALPIDTPEGSQYYAAMAAAVNFAFANRQLMTYQIRNLVNKLWGKKLKQKITVETVYDVAHNIAKWEEHHGQIVLVHRKGATRALPAGHPQNPPAYQTTGHPVLIPGSMGAASYVLVGTQKAGESFYSVNHGAGRMMSRTQARRSIKKDEFEQTMRQIVYNKPFHVIADEAPQAYKDIEVVIETLVEAGLVKKVAKLMPLAVVKGD